MQQLRPLVEPKVRSHGEGTVMNELPRGCPYVEEALEDAHARHQTLIDRWHVRLKDLTATLEVKLDNLIQDREMRA